MFRVACHATRAAGASVTGCVSTVARRSVPVATARAAGAGASGVADAAGDPHGPPGDLI